MKVALWAENLAYPVASVAAWADLVEAQVKAGGWGGSFPDAGIYSRALAEFRTAHAVQAGATGNWPVFQRKP